MNFISSKIRKKLYILKIMKIMQMILNLVKSEYYIILLICLRFLRDTM